MDKKYPVWDLGVRLFHWSLVGLMVFAWLSVENGEMERHETIGLAILTLLIFRILWGFVGSQHARFSDFIRGPASIKAYLAKQYEPKGHNPLGGLSVLGLLFFVATQAITGLMNADDVDYEGPLYDYVSDETIELASSIHSLGFNVLIALVVLHIAAIIVYRLRGKNLVKPMLTGYAEHSGESAPKPLWLLGMVAAVSAALVWIPAYLLG